MKLELDDFNVTYDDTPEVHKAVFEIVMEYFKDHEAFIGEVIVQDDNCIIDAPSVMARIADKIIKFKVDNKE